MSGKRGKYSVAKIGDARQIFEQELRRRKLAFERTADGRYSLELESGELTVSLENVARDFERDRDPEAITRFVERCVTSVHVPAWGIAQKWVYFSAEPSDHDFGDTLRAACSCPRTTRRCPAARRAPGRCSATPPPGWSSPS